MRRRGLLGMAAGIALVTSLAGCGGGGGDEGGQAGGNVDPKNVKGTITWWDTADATSERPAFKKLVDKFQAAYPNIKVKYQNVPFDAAQNKFKTAAQGGGAEAPDVIRAEVAWTPEFAALGYLHPLDDSPALDNAGDFLPTPLGSTKYNGKTYAVPQVTDTLGLLYNKRLLDEAGVRPPKTMADLKTAALAVKDKTGADGFYVNPQGYFLLPHIYGQGGDLLNAQSKKVTVDGPQAVAAVKEVQDLIASGAAPKPALTDGYTNMQAGFKDGKIAMVVNGPWSVPEDLEGKAFKGDEDNLGVAPIPAGAGGQGAPTGGHNYGIYAGSKNIPAAELFVKFMSSAESQAQIADELGLMPTRKSAYDDPKVKDNARITAFQPVLAKQKPRAWIPEGGLLFLPLDQQYTKILSGDATPEQGLKAVAEEYRNKILKGWS